MTSDLQDQLLPTTLNHQRLKQLVWSSYKVQLDKVLKTSTSMNKQGINLNYQHKLNPILNLAQSTNSTNILTCQTTTIKQL